MKRHILIILIISQALFCFSQKRALDTTAIARWETVDQGQISNDGNWASFRILKGAHDPRLEVVVKSISGSYEAHFQDVGSLTFSSDSKYAVFIRKNNLCYLRLGQKMLATVRGVNSFQLLTTKKGDYLVYKKQAAASDLYIKDLKTLREETYNNVEDYKIDGQKLFLVTKINKGSYQLHSLDPLQNRTEHIYSGPDLPENVLVANDQSKIAFLANYKIWFYARERGKHAYPVAWANQQIVEGRTIDRIDGFTHENQGLLFTVKESRAPAFDKDLKNLKTVFSYQDAAFEMGGRFQQGSYQVYGDLETGHISQITEKGDRLISLSSNGKLALISKVPRGGEYYWNKKQSGLNNLKDVFTGKITELMIGGVSAFIEKGDYLIYQKEPRGDIFSLNTKDEKVINLIESLPIPFVNIDGDLRTQQSRGLSIQRAQTIFDGQLFFVSDGYDIWKLNASCKEDAVCLTGGYGREHQLNFKLIDESNFATGKPVYLEAFDLVNKEAGFYKLNGEVGKAPVKLTMGPYAYADEGGSHVKPMKAKQADIWLVQRQSNHSSANYYWTRDFRTFQPVSDVHPEKNYNGYTTELINYTTNDGVKSQAILYKPDNLDTTRKYPVLFNYYEKRSHELNQFEVPNYLRGHIAYEFNFPLMLGKGYLICVPDIQFKLGQPARNIVDCVEGAADAISNRAYVDTAHFGASGGSFGGYATNCLAAFSHRFKALVPISSGSDIISMYGNLPGLRDEEVENRQFRMGVSLSTAPDLYLHNSPVAYTRNVTSPILIMNGAKDINVNPQQGIEWFISLRREGKPAWMVWYPDEDHGILQHHNQQDFSMRLSQFFDHYLKGAPTPKWMTDSQNLWVRPGKEGFELMPAGVEPGPGLNTAEDIERSKSYLKKNKP